MSTNIALLQSSFLKVIPQKQRFARVFYDTLFHDHPEIKPLFAATDMHVQQSKLFSLLSMTINNLGNPAMLRFTLHELGKHHMRYKVKPEYFPLVGDALLKTFAVILDKDWTPALQEAWAEGYQVIANLMCESFRVETRAAT
jgi:hemoglobin-like flavoprotein